MNTGVKQGQGVAKPT